MISLLYYEDRKTLSVFEFKVFLFKNQPNHYPLEASAKLDDEIQVSSVVEKTKTELNRG